MTQINRNQPCPCGSGKKYKHCHLGREEELVTERLERLPEDAADKICALPEVRYGRCAEFMSKMDVQKLTDAAVGLRFVDLKAYLSLGYVPRQIPQDINRVSAGQMINPFKTAPKDRNNIYIAISPAVSPSTLIHQIAHALDYLAGSRLNPGLAGPLSMELEAPIELLEHPKEFGYWLNFLANEFGVDLDAEDMIVSYLFEQGRLLPGELLASGDRDRIGLAVKATIRFLKDHRADIDERIRNREGYVKQDDSRTH